MRFQGAGAFEGKPCSSTRHRAVSRSGTDDPAERVAFVPHDPDATAVADGGGLATTFLRPIEGAGPIARAWIELERRRPADMAVLERTVNGQPGLVARQDGVTVVTVFAFDVAHARVQHIRVVRDPGKLRRGTLRADVV